ncbi:unnamed protein product [Rangifer tarandus platyrhynchus]|uniref:Uncharacterized protein n=2 Tax=Rangifer tarandus platyrhynchus TaxID=3082113 RepID=A0ACB0ENK7_RANTA|nr:unnamed protein product [Rangifer tarandus platyrhynchus]CAI9701701.1 unnamed protein product [Rangifer tarandus platyrhynchus]
MPESGFSSLLNRDLGFGGITPAARSGARKSRAGGGAARGWSAPWRRRGGSDHYLPKQERFLGGAARGLSQPETGHRNEKRAALGSGEGRSAPSLGSPLRKGSSRIAFKVPWPRSGGVPPGGARKTEGCGLRMPGAPAELTAHFRTQEPGGDDGSQSPGSSSAVERPCQRDLTQTLGNRGYLPT